MRRLHAWSYKEKEYLKTITPGHHHKEIQTLMNEKFKLALTIGQIRAAVKRYNLKTGFTGCFNKGHIPVNRGKHIGGWKPTQFKKGHIPENHRTIGSERIDADGYTWIKVKEPNTWKQKHKLIWEKHNGKVKQGYVVIFGDGNKNNFDIDNLILVSKKQLLILNRNKLIKNDADLTRTGILIADIYSKISEKKNRK